jgi:GMP synthase-like glutamine amidotransferase
MKIAIINCDLDESIQTNGGCLLKELFVEVDLINYHEGEVISDFSGYDGFVITGSRAHINQVDLYPWLKNVKKAVYKIEELNKPCLGVCFGMHIVSDVFGGRVEVQATYEVGFKKVLLDNTNKLFYGLNNGCMVYEAHKDYTSLMPIGSTVLAQNELCVQAFQYKNFYCLQFHPEINYSVAKLMAERDGDNLESVLGCVENGYDKSKIIVKNFIEICENYVN